MIADNPLPKLQLPKYTVIGGQKYCSEEGLIKLLESHDAIIAFEYSSRLPNRMNDICISCAKKKKLVKA